MTVTLPKIRVGDTIIVFDDKQFVQHEGVYLRKDGNSGHILEKANIFTFDMAEFNLIKAYSRNCKEISDVKDLE
jgi:hypothetical protein